MHCWATRGHTLRCLAQCHVLHPVLWLLGYRRTNAHAASAAQQHYVALGRGRAFLGLNLRPLP